MGKSRVAPRDMLWHVPKAARKLLRTRPCDLLHGSRRDGSMRQPRSRDCFCVGSPRSWPPRLEWIRGACGTADGDLAFSSSTYRTLNDEEHAIIEEVMLSSRGASGKRDGLAGAQQKQGA